MSYMRGDLLTKTWKVVKGLAKAEPIWLKAKEKASPLTFRHAANKLKQITLPEDAYVNKFFQKHLNSKFEDPIDTCLNPFASYCSLQSQSVVCVLLMEYRAEKKVYARLKEIAKEEGKKLPPNPYPSAIREIQAEERKFVGDRFHDHQAYQIIKKLEQERAEQMMGRRGGFYGP